MTLLHTMMQYTTLWTIADVTEQKYISKKLKHDWQKTLRMATVGTFVVAPLVFSWIRIAERIFPGKHWRSVCKKVLMDQVVFAPIAVSSFYASTCCLEGKSVQQFKEEWKVKFPRTYINGMKIWPAVQLINFSFVPIIHRPKVISCVSFGWSIYLCFQKEDSHDETKVPMIHVNKEGDGTILAKSIGPNIEGLRHRERSVLANSEVKVTDIKPCSYVQDDETMRKNLILMPAETHTDCIENITMAAEIHRDCVEDKVN